MAAPGARAAGGGDDAVEAGWQLAGRDGSGRSIRLVFGESELRRAYPGLTLGRHPKLCDLLIDDPSVSRRHVRICRDGDGIVVEDLNSLNGTVLAGRTLRPFEPVPLHAGETLTIGLVTLTLSPIATA